MKKLRRALVASFVSIVAFALAVVGVRSFSRRIVFPADRVETLLPPPDVTKWSVVARDGVAVHALELAGPANAQVFVYFHNNRETMVHGLALGRELNLRGFDVVLPEYRGYGLSRGAEPSEEGLYYDAEAVLDRLSERHLGPRRIVLCGASLGTGVAAEMARRGRGSALVLISPYTSLPGVARAVVPLLPAELLMLDRFDTLGKSRDIRVPTLVVHGEADEIIPFWMGNVVAHAIPGARFMPIAGGHHGDLFVRSGRELLSAITTYAQRS